MGYMKRSYYIIIFVLFSILSLGINGCGSSNTNLANSSTQVVAEQAYLEDKTNYEKEKNTEETAETSKGKEVVESIIVDNDYCTFTITGIDKEDMWGYAWKVFIENKMDNNLMFSLNDVSVNGVMCDPFWAETVNGKMKSNSTVNFSNDELIAAGITNPTDFEFVLRVSDSDNWELDPFVEETFVYYPYGKDDSGAGSSFSTDNLTAIFENESCAMYIVGFEPDNMWGYTMNVYIENKTEDKLMFSINDAAVNGFMCDPFWAKEVAPGKNAFSSISWSESEFEQNDISVVETITLPVTVSVSDDWTGDYILEETFTVTP